MSRPKVEPIGPITTPLPRKLEVLAALARLMADDIAAVLGEIADDLRRQNGGKGQI